MLEVPGGRRRGNLATCGAGPTSAREPGNSSRGGFGRGDPGQGPGARGERGWPQCPGDAQRKGPASPDPCPGGSRGGGEGERGGGRRAGVPGLPEPRISTTDRARAARPARGRGGHREPGTGNRHLPPAGRGRTLRGGGGSTARFPSQSLQSTAGPLTHRGRRGPG